MPRFKRILLARRRIDPLVLGLGAASAPLYLPTGVAVSGLFGVIGLYVACSNRRRFAAYLYSPFGIILTYIAWVAAVMMVRGELNLSNSQLGFMGLLLCCSFIAPGLCLIREPLRWLIYGARIGIVAVFLAALAYIVISWGEVTRYDGGGNAAIFAFLIALGAISAIIPVARPPRLLPNSLLYLAIALVPIFLSQTRAILIVVPLILAYEFAVRSREWPPRFRNRAYATAAIGLALTLLVPQVQHLLAERFGSMYRYYVLEDDAIDMTSGDIRLELWQSAAAVIREHPIIGVGLGNIPGELERVAGPDAALIAGFKHVHNFVLQEVLANGLIGLLLFLSIFASISWAVLASDAPPALRRAYLTFFLTVILFGLLHDPFYHEGCLAAIMLFVGVLLAQVQRWNRIAPGAAPWRR